MKYVVYVIIIVAGVFLVDPLDFKSEWLRHNVVFANFYVFIFALIVRGFSEYCWTIELFAKEVDKNTVPPKGTATYEAVVKIVYKNGDVFAVELVPDTTIMTTPEFTKAS